MLAVTPSPMKMNANEKRSIDGCHLEQEKFIASSKELNKYKDAGLPEVSVSGNSLQSVDRKSWALPEQDNSKKVDIMDAQPAQFGEEQKQPKLELGIAPVDGKSQSSAGGQVGIQGNQGNQFVQENKAPQVRMPYVDKLISSKSHNED